MIINACEGDDGFINVQVKSLCIYFVRASSLFMGFLSKGIEGSIGMNAFLHMLLVFFFCFYIINVIFDILDNINLIALTTKNLCYFLQLAAENHLCFTIIVYEFPLLRRSMILCFNILPTLIYTVKIILTIPGYLSGFLTAFPLAPVIRQTGSI